MFNHVMSTAHTESFLKEQRVWSDIATVDEQIEEHKENGKFDYIEVVHSDEMVILFSSFGLGLMIINRFVRFSIPGLLAWLRWASGRCLRSSAPAFIAAVGRSAHMPGGRHRRHRS